MEVLCRKTNILWFLHSTELQYVRRSVEKIANRKIDPAINGGYYFSDSGDQNRNGIAEEDEIFFLPDLYENIKLKLEYLELPVLVKYEFFGGTYGLFVESGIHLGYSFGGVVISRMVSKDKKMNQIQDLLTSEGSEVYSFSDLLSTYDTPEGLGISYSPYKDPPKDKRSKIQKI